MPWLASALAPDTGFPLENLPYGAYAADSGVHLCVAIGDQMLDLFTVAETGLLDGLAAPLQDACRQPRLNGLMGLDVTLVHALRERLQTLLTSADARRRELVTAALCAQEESRMRLPVAIGDYTDFYASRDHARNVGSLFRPANPLLPNYAWVPVGYHGRSSSVGVSPAMVIRPRGQLGGGEGQAPAFGACRQLDYEVEAGAFVGRGNRQGEPIPLREAGGYVFGLCLLNDWSARDIQRWEYQPLGPFLGKNFATTLSPWIVPWEALAPYRVPRAARGADDPAPLDYLEDAGDRTSGGLDVTVEVALATAAMRQQGMAPVRLSRGNLKDLFWTLGQMVAHHTSNGCNLRPGDLLGTGTVSGPEPGARGCLLELTRGGKEPLTLPSGETRTYLADGDEISMSGYCQRPGQVRLGFGVCRGRVVANPDL
ncbi:MAG: fumarylacetoacetase [Terriglobales bacterium]